jgi:glycogen(starch) synthase
LKIVVYSPAFHPMIGGLETVVQVLATEWSKLGHQVTVVTDALNAEPDSFPFKVLRGASFFGIVQAVREGDVFVHANVSLWGLLPWLFCGLRRPPWVATHHGWYFHLDKPVRWRDRLKIWLTHLASANISVSDAVNRHLGSPGVVIPNPYDNLTFRLLPDVTRNIDLVFLGRLVSDKGVDLLLDALVLLGLQGRRPSLTIIGSGPEEAALREQAVVHGLTEQVTFAGPKHDHELSKLLNTHRIMVIPSRCHEGFGIVALEGIACGCIVVGANGGGLPEAIGPCGLIFPMGDVPELASRLEYLLANESVCQALQSHAKLHLVGHYPAHIAKGYLDVFHKVINR